MPFTGYWSNGPGVYVCDQPHCSARTVTVFRCWWKQDLRAVGGSCSNAGAIWCPRGLGVKKGNEVYTHWIMDHVVTGPLVTPTTAAPTVTQTSPDGDQTDSDAAPTVTQTTAAPAVTQSTAAPDQPLDQVPPPPPPKASEVPQPPLRRVVTAAEILSILERQRERNQNEILSILEAQAERLGRIESRLDRMNVDPFGFTEQGTGTATGTKHGNGQPISENAEHNSFSVNAYKKRPFGPPESRQPISDGPSQFQ